MLGCALALLLSQLFVLRRALVSGRLLLLMLTFLSKRRVVCQLSGGLLAASQQLVEESHPWSLPLDLRGRGIIAYEPALR
jgi:hypothetical protein